MTRTKAGARARPGLLLALALATACAPREPLYRGSRGELPVGEAASEGGPPAAPRDHAPAPPSLVEPVREDPRKAPLPALREEDGPPARRAAGGSAPAADEGAAASPLAAEETGEAKAGAGPSEDPPAASTRTAPSRLGAAKAAPKAGAKSAAAGAAPAAADSALPPSPGPAPAAGEAALPAGAADAGGPAPAAAAEATAFAPASRASGASPAAIAAAPPMSSFGRDDMEQMLNQRLDVGAYRIQISASRTFDKVLFDRTYDAMSDINLFAEFRAAGVAIDREAYWVRIAFIDLLQVEEDFTAPRLYSLDKKRLDDAP